MLANTTARTRLMIEVTLVRANLRTAYRILDAETGERLPDDTSPDVGKRTLQVESVESVGRRDLAGGKAELADAWLVLDSNGAAIGALYKWEGRDGGWSAYRTRQVDRLPADTSHLTDAQHRAWTHTIALETETLAAIAGRGNQGALVYASVVSGEKSRAAAMTRAGWVTA